ncbi:MAG: hypothetical protein AAGA48_08810 [Myxococcota bacterium]
MMTRLALVAGAWFALDSNAHATSVDLGVNALAATTGTAAISIDVAASPTFSLEGLVGAGRSTIDLDGGQRWDYVWHPNNLVGKFYFIPDKGADRFHALVFGCYESRIFQLRDHDLDFDPDVTARRIGAGAGIGWKQVFDVGLVLEATAGAGYEFARCEAYETPDRSGEVPDTEWDPLLVLARVGLGWRF